MPSNLLKARLPKFAEAIAGSETVTYYEFDPTATDNFTGTVNETAGYPTIGITLTALVDFSPSENLRKMIGSSIDFDAMLLIAVQHLTDNDITLKVGDAFVLPSDSDKSYVKKVVQTHQTEIGHIVRIVAVSHRRGRR